MALFGAGGIAFGATPASAMPSVSPAAATTAAGPPASAVTAAPAAGPRANSKAGSCMSGEIEGSGASPMIHHGGPVLVGLHGFNPDKTSSSTKGPTGNDGPQSGGLRPVGSPNWHPRPWTSHQATANTSSGNVRSGEIEGSGASPMIHHGGPVLVGLHGFNPDRTSSSTKGSTGNEGPQSGGLRPVGSPNWHPRPWTTYTAGCANGH